LKNPFSQTSGFVPGRQNRNRGITFVLHSVGKTGISSNHTVWQQHDFAPVTKQ